MRFSTIKEMESKLKEITNKSELQEEIRVMSQGTELVFSFLGEGSTTAEGKEIAYMCNDTADGLRIKFTETPNGISIHTIKVTRV